MPRHMTQRTCRYSPPYIMAYITAHFSWMLDCFMDPVPRSKVSSTGLTEDEIHDSGSIFVDPESHLWRLFAIGALCPVFPISGRTSREDGRGCPTMSALTTWTQKDLKNCVEEESLDMEMNETRYTRPVIRKLVYSP